MGYPGVDGCKGMVRNKENLHGDCLVLHDNINLFPSVHLTALQLLMKRKGAELSGSETSHWEEVRLQGSQQPLHHSLHFTSLWGFSYLLVAAQWVHTTGTHEVAKESRSEGGLTVDPGGDPGCEHLSGFSGWSHKSQFPAVGCAREGSLHQEGPPV